MPRNNTGLIKQLRKTSAAMDRRQENGEWNRQTEVVITLRRLQRICLQLILKPTLLNTRALNALLDTAKHQMLSAGFYVATGTWTLLQTRILKDAPHSSWSHDCLSAWIQWGALAYAEMPMLHLTQNSFKTMKEARDDAEGILALMISANKGPLPTLSDHVHEQLSSSLKQQWESHAQSRKLEQDTQTVRGSARERRL